METNTLIDAETNKPTNTATIIEAPSNQYLLENCVEIVENPHKTFPGVLVLHEGLLNLTTFQLQPFEVSPYRDASLVSPDGERLAVVSDKSELLLIQNTSGEVIKGFPLNDLTPLYWLDDSNLVLQKATFDSYEYGLASFILNIQTGSIVELDVGVYQINTYSDELGNYWEYAYQTRTSINPLRSHLIFPRGHPNELVLWDIANNEEVLRFPAFIGTSLPRWNSSGNEFIISAETDFMNSKSILFSYGGNELFTINLFGNIKQLSNISEVTGTYQHHYVWSPDDQNIAFLLEYIDYGMDGFLLDVLPIAILDVQTGRVEDLCITADLPPVWSPDGKYLAISDYIEGVIIIDLIENKAYRVHDPEFYTIHGWMN